MRTPIRGAGVLVTGGAGFIGSHLVDRLLAEGAREVVAVDNLFVGSLDNLRAARAAGAVFYSDDLELQGTLDYVLGRHRIDIVFNCATKALNYSFLNPANALATNVTVVLNLLEAQRRGAFSTLCHFSTSEVYGTAAYEPMDEAHPRNPTTTYAAGKAAADLALESYVRMFGLDAFIVRPFNNYGPRQNHEGMLAGLIPITAWRLARGLAPVVQGTGQQTREFVHVLDTVDAVLSLYALLQPGESVNICGDECLSVSDVIARICRHFDYRGEPERAPARVADVWCHRGSNARLLELVSFAPRPFEQGLAQTLEWYRKRFREAGGRQRMIRLIRPYVRFEDLEQELREIFASGIFTRGPWVERFTTQLREYTRAQHVFTVTSATTALRCCIELLGIGTGDEVVVADFSFPATANVVEDAGARPVFADVSLDTFNMLPQALERRIGPRTRAVIFVDAFGNPSGIDEIAAICRARGIPLIDDAACAFGSRIDERRSGNLADLSCLSFHPRKLLTTGEGGAILCNRADWAEWLRVKLAHGANGTLGAGLDFVDSGYNYRLSEIQALMGCAQIGRLDAVVAERQAMLARYRELLEPHGFIAQRFDAGVKPNVQSVVFRVPEGVGRDALIAGLRTREVEATLGTYCLSGTTYYRRRYGDVQPNAEKLFHETLTLPCFPGLDVDEVCAIVGAVVHAH